MQTPPLTKVDTAKNRTSFFGLMILCTTLFFVLMQPKRVPMPEFPVEELRQVSIPSYAPHPILQQMTVMQAFKLVPKIYVGFTADKLSIPANEAKYLEELFSIVDLAVVERVSLQRALMFGSKHDFNKMARNHGEILRRMEALSYPEKLEKVHLLIRNAVFEQKNYFDNWKRFPDKEFNYRDPLVQLSHQKLVRAYMELTAIYAEEDE